MRYLSLRRGRFTSQSSWPVGGSSNWKLDYSGGFVQTENLTREVGGYFFLNEGWKRAKLLFSHTLVRWNSAEGGAWEVRVWYVGRRRWTKRFLLLRLFRRLTVQKRRHRPRRATKEARRGRPPGVTKFIRTSRVARLVRRRRRWLETFFVPEKSFLSSSFRWGRPVEINKAGSLLSWTEMAKVWGRPRRATKWVWCFLPGVSQGVLATLTNQLKYRMVGRFERQIRAIAFPLLGATRKLPGAVGAHLRCAGRFTRRQRADHQSYRWGRLGRTNPAAQVDESFLTVPLRFGAVGMTLVVHFEG